MGDRGSVEAPSRPYPRRDRAAGAALPLGSRALTQATARTTEREAASVDEQEACNLEKELVQTQQLPTGLEGPEVHVRRSRPPSSCCWPWLSAGAGRGVAGPLPTVAGERRRADLAERACGEAAAEAEALRSRAAGEALARHAAEARAAQTAEQVLELQRRLACADAEAAARVPQAEGARRTEDAELRAQLTAERVVRRKAENRAAEKEVQIVALKRRLAAEQAKSQERLAEEEARREQSEGELPERDFQLRELQRQLAEEFSTRIALQVEVADQQRQLRELRLVVKDLDLSRQQVATDQMIEKEREVCELQKQLAEELAKRQAVQNLFIEKERCFCMLQQQVLRLQSTMPRQRMLVLPSHAEEELEPDNEQAPRTPGVGCTAVPVAPREESEPDRERPPGSASSRASLPQEPEPDYELPPGAEEVSLEDPVEPLGALEAPPSFSGGLADALVPPQPAAARERFSNHQAYRSPASGASSAVVGCFVRSTAPTILVGTNTMADASKARIGTVGSGLPGCPRWPPAPPMPRSPDTHARQLVLASRTVR